MKSKLLLLIGLCFFTFSNAQNFTKITTGSLVNDQYESEGCAWGDYDNDGYLDLFVTNGLFKVQKNCLYRNEGASKNFSFTKITVGETVNDEAGSRAASWGDYDNDGDLDLFVVTQPIPIRKSTGKDKNEKPDAEKESTDIFKVDNRTICTNFLYQNNGDGTFKHILEGIAVKEAHVSDPGGWLTTTTMAF